MTAPTPRVAEIQQAAAIEFDVTIADLVSQRRDRATVQPRQIAMYLARHLTPQSLSDIGRRFGDRDHTTVLHAVRPVDHSAELRFEAERVARRVAGIVAAREQFDSAQLALAL